MEERSLTRIVVGLLIVVGVWIMGGQGRAEGAWVESLVMPGEVVQGHASIESKCESCHERFKQAEQDRLCLACHKEIAADLEAQLGFHGRTDKVRAGPCKECHTEHKGRTANIVPLDRATFDHARTDFVLREAHARVRCEGCHRPGVKYRAAPRDCAGCHEATDPHHGSLGNACGSCHQEDSWKQARFDHDTAAFQLRGKHRTVECERCHPEARYKSTPTACGGCHAGDDKHGGRFGSRCETCHTADRWAAVVFDHARATRFALEGHHAATPCLSCHTGRLYEENISKACQGCHAADDAHRGRFGPKCESCHTAKGWAVPIFDHAARTKFPLEGKHREARCEDCHRGDSSDERLESRCYACHQTDDVHQGQQGEACDRCHDARGWKQNVLFEHDLTRFPLVGKHVAVPCEKCHPSKAFKGTSLECMTCHREVDVHGGALPRCRDCHNPSDWKVWDFDHDTQTTFKLDGAHQGVACRACHPEVAVGKAARRRVCGACHEADDVHRGQFGRACDRCHVTTSFRVIERVR